jgi:hypothetical protein
VKLIKVGSPTDNYWFTIEANNGGVPSNTPLATSDYYDASRLTTTATWVRIPFRTPYSVSAATQYHLVMYGDFTVSATNYIGWRMDGSAAAYGNGSKALYDSDTTTWTSDTDDDMMFKVYVTENDTSVTLPSGYSQYAKIGYCYNNGSSNLKHFWQQDRTVFCGYDDDWQIGALADTTPALVSLSAFLPPVDCIADWIIYNAGGGNVSLGVLNSPDLTATLTDERVGVNRSTCSTIVVNGLPSLAMSAYQGVMYITNAGTTNLYLNTYRW